MMYDDLRDLANRTPATDCEGIQLADAMAYRFGDVEQDAVAREDPDHNDFLYLSTNRPLGAWFEPPTEYSLLGGTRRRGVAGTSVPLSMDALNSFQLVPLDEHTRATTVAKAWDGGPLASAKGDRGMMERVQLLLDVPEHPRDVSRIVYDEKGPARHFCYDVPDPTWSRDPARPVTEGIRDLLRGDWEMIPASIAEDQVQRWLEDLGTTEHLVPA